MQTELRPNTPHNNWTMEETGWWVHPTLGCVCQEGTHRWVHYRPDEGQAAYPTLGAALATIRLEQQRPGRVGASLLQAVSEGVDERCALVLKLRCALDISSEKASTLVDSSLRRLKRRDAPCYDRVLQKWRI